jgi:hypothetical protein
MVVFGPVIVGLTVLLLVIGACGGEIYSKQKYILLRVYILITSYILKP